MEDKILSKFVEEIKEANKDDCKIAGILVRLESVLCGSGGLVMVEDEFVNPTIKGYEQAFIALMNLMSNHQLHEDDFLILDVYCKMATGHEIEDLLRKMSKKDLVVIREREIVKIQFL